MGRPPLPKGESKDAQIGVRFKPDEFVQLNTLSQASASSNSEAVRIATLSQIQTPPIWVKSRWKWEELNDQTIDYYLTESFGVLHGIGRLKARPNPNGLITVDIVACSNPTAKTAHAVRVWLGEAAVNKIELHPDQTKAKFLLKGNPV